MISIEMIGVWFTGRKQNEKLVEGIVESHASLSFQLDT
jgi:hypothetical protein